MVAFLAICEIFRSSKGARPNGNTPMQTDPEHTQPLSRQSINQSINQSSPRMTRQRPNASWTSARCLLWRCRYTPVTRRHDSSDNLAPTTIPTTPQWRVLSLRGHVGL